MSPLLAISDVTEMLKTLAGVGGSGVLLFLVWALMTGKLVTPDRLQEEREEKEWWRDVAMRGLHITERTVNAAEKIVRTNTEQGKDAD